MTFTPWPIWSSSIPIDKFGFLRYLTSWGGYNNGDSNKEMILTQSTPCDKSFWVLTPINI